MRLKIEIKCRLSGSVLFSHEAEDNTLKLTMEAAVQAGAYLDGAYLDGANLSGAYLCRAYLAGAYLAGANLSGANLSGANLDGAYLDGAYLCRAYLAGAYLARVNLAGANLSGANLDGANLDGELLTKAPLSLLNMTWPVLITEGYMRIGCQRHSHVDWATFSADEIAEMESRASSFWGQWRDVLLAMCKKHSGA